MTSLGLSTVWMGETAANMMNAIMHSLKLTSGDSPAPRWLPWALLAAIAVGLLGSIWFTMTLAYTYGGINLHGWYFSGAPRWPFTYMASVYNAPEPSFAPRLAFTASGSFVMAASALFAPPLHVVAACILWGFPSPLPSPLFTMAGCPSF